MQFQLYKVTKPEEPFYLRLHTLNYEPVKITMVSSKVFVITTPVVCASKGGSAFFEGDISYRKGRSALNSKLVSY